MAGVATNGSGVGRSLEGVSSGQQQQRFQSGEALAEWRSLEQVENGSPSTSPPYWDCDDDDDDGGPKPSDLYGKYTWKIDKFSQLNKRELRSNAFEVGGYKWYILIYPQGCDVCNHLSLFLCVSHHDKLLPGWSHFAQFTIAVVNKDPKKSKYSDTLHRFWKKEHDWGWKKFMELSKVLDGFVDSDTLIIKAQVQVIRERVDRPFRCLDCQYRRELVRVYLTNVEQICRRFVEERRGKLVKLIEDKARWSSFRAFWVSIDHSSRRRMSREKTESILKIVVKHFFIEKEVTSTLVMDSLYSGLKALEGQNNKGKKSKVKCLEAEELPVPIVCIEKDTFALVDDVLSLLERAAIEPLPPKDEKGPQNRTKDGSAGEDFNKDSIERDERRLTELGRRTVEIFVLAHIFSKIEVAYQEAVALKKQEELIREEEAAWLAELEQKARRGSTDKDKKSKKKQGKQKKNNRKGKDKGRDEKAIIAAQEKIDEDIIAERKSELVADPEIVLEKSEAVEDLSDVSDSIDCAPEIPIPDSEDTDLSLVNWDTDASELHPPIEAGSSGLSGLQNGMERRSTSVVDDSSSTCSSDSIPPIVVNVANKGKSRYNRNQNSPSRGTNHQSKLISEPANRSNEVPIQPAVLDARRSNDASRSSNAVGSNAHPSTQSLPGRVVNGAEQHAGKKEVEAGSFHRNNSNVKAANNYNFKAANNSNVKAANNSNVKAAVDVLVPLMTQTKLKPKIISPSNPVIVSRPSADIPNQAVNFSTGLSSSSAQSSATLKPVAEPQKLTTSKPKEMPVTADKSSIPPMPVMSRPLSAPLVPGPRPAVSMVSMVQTAPVLARSVSAAGRLGPEPTTTVFTNQSFVPQSYRNAIIGGPVAGSSSAYSSLGIASSHLFSQAPHSLASAQLFSPHISDRADHNPIQPNLSFGMVNHRETLQNGPVWIEHPNNMQGYDLYNPVRSRQPDHLPSEFRPLPSGRQSHQLPEEFPHLDIINDLLDDEHGIGMAARVNSGYQGFGNGPHNLNRHYSFPGDPAMLGGLGPSCRFDGARSYHDEGIHLGYGRTYDTVRDMIPTQVGPYLNGHIDGFMPNQWPIGGSDVPYVSVRNMDNDGGYTYHMPEYSNLTGTGINGYTVYGPSNGH